MKYIKIDQTCCQVSNPKIPKSFDGFKICQISDLHNTVFGKKNIKLIRRIQKARPDIIVITGDLIDSRRLNIDAAMNFVAAAMEIAPCYYVPGNHETRLPEEYEEIVKVLREMGAVVLDGTYVRKSGDRMYNVLSDSMDHISHRDMPMKDTCAVLRRGDDEILLYGVVDPIFLLGKLNESKNAGAMNRALKRMKIDTGKFNMLLSHRPELIKVYAAHKLDLVLCGHAHGGQFRLPFVGAVFAPNQGFWPKYTAGQVKKGGTTMVVSRGLGESVIPFRINNRPEIVYVVLESADVINKS